ncbi:hypothetical protein [Candidatus Symbiobacter mobilis]|uniref:Uncharacterized protein n=1 Tax=Candidatus Symbiobacter mobilis CR TaxID=946483 RepID=U5N916_9BURK|nr:hypothetical protein [Candidatus Symbiobacter mobilis]AGX87820.1 hypothetical protein Cenrod_1736 [Candidatus Symbiobacter mobilis CR]
MQLPTIDRIPGQRPISADAAAFSTGRVIPVPPVNTAPHGLTEPVATPSVINMINRSHQNELVPNDGDGIYAKVYDPSRVDPSRGGDPLDAQDPEAKTRRVSETEEAKEPPKPPLQELIINYLKSLWEASASAIQVQQQAKDELRIQPKEELQHLPKGEMSTEVFTYSPNKIQKAEKPLT